MRAENRSCSGVISTHPARGDLAARGWAVLLPDPGLSTGYGQQRLPPLLFALVEWLDGPPEQAWNGVLFANEVIDALPTPRFVSTAAC